MPWVLYFKKPPWRHITEEGDDEYDDYDEYFEGENQYPPLESFQFEDGNNSTQQPHNKTPKCRCSVFPKRVTRGVIDKLEIMLF